MPLTLTNAGNGSSTHANPTTLSAHKALVTLHGGYIAVFRLIDSKPVLVVNVYSLSTTLKIRHLNSNWLAVRESFTTTHQRLMSMTNQLAQLVCGFHNREEPVPSYSAVTFPRDYLSPLR